MMNPVTRFAQGGGRAQDRWGRLAIPSLFFIGVIYYEELFLKLYCFRSITLTGALFTLLFTLPVGLLLGLLCGGVSPVGDSFCCRRAPPLSPCGWGPKRFTTICSRPF